MANGLSEVTVDPSVTPPASDTSETQPPDPAVTPPPEPSNVVDVPEAEPPEPTPAQTDTENKLKASPVVRMDNPFQQSIVAARLQGHTWDDIDKFVNDKVQAATTAGYTRQQIEDYMGVAPGQLDAFETLLKAQAANVQEEGPHPSGFGAGLLAGFTNDSSLSPLMDDAMKRPEIRPEDAGMMTRIGQFLGMSGPDLAATAGGAAVGTAVGGPVGAAVGGAIGFFLSDDVRHVVADAKINGGNPNDDFAAKMVANSGKAAIDTGIMVASGGAGKYVGGMTSAAIGGIGGKVLGGAANVGTQLATMTTAGAIVSGQMPTFQDTIDNAIQLAAFHVGGEVGKVTPKLVADGYNKLTAAWGFNGQPPAVTVARVKAGQPPIPPTPPAIPPASGGPPIPPAPPPRTPVPVAVTVGRLEGGLRGLSRGAQADDLTARQFVATLPREIANAPASGGWGTLDEKFYHHWERPDEVPLDPREQALFDQHARPVKDIEAQWSARARPYMDPVAQSSLDPDGYMHRIKVGQVAGPAGQLEEGENSNPVFGRRGVGVKASSTKSTVFRTIVNENTGERVVVQEAEGGDGVRIFRNGVRDDKITYGATWTRVPENTRTPETIPERVKIDRPHIAEISKADQWVKMPGMFRTGFLRIRKGDIIPPWVRKGGDIVPEHESSDATTPEHWVDDSFSKATHFIGMDSDDKLSKDTWKFERPNTAELEQHTSIRYQKSFFSNTIDNITRMQRMVREKEFLETMKASPEWNDHAVQAGSGERAEAPAKKTFGFNPKNGKTIPYVSINHPAFQGWLVHPDVANPINDYLNGGPSLTERFSPLLAMNKLAIGAMFSTPIGAIAHLRNLAGMALIGRGFDNLNVVRCVRTGFRAIDAVWNAGPEYIDALRRNATLISGGIQKNSLAEFVMNKAGQDIVRADEWKPWAKSLGLEKASDLGSWWMTHMSKELYRMGDILYMQRYFELQEKGLSKEAAIGEVEKYLPNYQIGSKLLGSRALAQAMGDSNIVAFGRYEVSKFRAITNMFNDLLGRWDEGLDPQRRFDALGRFAVTAFMLYVVAPQLNYLAQKITGNPDAQINMGGTLGMFQRVEDFAEHPSASKFFSTLGSFTSPAPGTEELAQQMFNMDFFTGKTIRAGNPVQYVGEGGVHAANQLFSPLGAITDWAKYVGRAVGVNDPTAGAMFFRNLENNGGDPRVIKSNAKHDPHWLQSLTGNTGGE